MTVATKTQPNYTTQQAAAYKAAIDGITAVHDRVAGAFAPHEQDVGSPAPDLSMRVDAGFIFAGTTLTEVAAQTVSGFTTPSAGQERIDRVVLDAITGVASRVAGTAVSGSPSAVAPDIPLGKLPCAQIRFTDASTAVLNSMITDERIPAAGRDAYVYIRDEQTSGTAGGAFNSGGWRTRTLNTEVNDSSGVASLSSNQVTLQAGTYRFKARAPALYVDGHKCRLANVTDSNYYYGSNAYTDAVGAGRMTDSVVSGEFTITSAKTFELQHYCQTTKSGDGFGSPMSFGVIEVFTEVEFWRVG
jgi:hypothetical protein